MPKNDGGRSGGIDRDRGVARSTDNHVADVAGAAVDGDRCCYGERTVVAARKAIDLGDAALVDSALECEARVSLATIAGVAAIAGDPQCLLRLDRTCR